MLPTRQSSVLAVLAMAAAVVVEVVVPDRVFALQPRLVLQLDAPKRKPVLEPQHAMLMCSFRQTYTTQRPLHPVVGSLKSALPVVLMIGYGSHSTMAFLAFT
jgi:hypothetical protein